MSLSSALALPAVLLLAFTVAAEPAAPPKLVVVPFAALSGSVPQRAGTKASGMLATEIRNTEGLTLVDPRKGTVADPAQEGLVHARKLVEEASNHRKKRKFRLAEESLTQALAQYKTSAAGISDVGELADAYALLAAIDYNTGRDEEGAKNLTHALNLAPGRALPLAASSPGFTRVVQETRKSLDAAPKGALLVESTPAGAAVWLDGVAVGSSPLQVRSIPAGLHFWRVTMPSGTAGGLVEIAGGKSVKVAGQMPTRDPESKILAALSQNRIDAELVAAAKEHAAAAQSDLLLLGALSSDSKGLTLDSFLFSAATGEVRRLQRASFDVELLSAGMELFNLATSMKEKGAKAGEVVRIPSAVSLTALSGSSKVAEVQYGAQAKEAAQEEGAAEPARSDTGAAPVEKRRVPLKKTP